MAFLQHNTNERAAAITSAQVLILQRLVCVLQAQLPSIMYADLTNIEPTSNSVKFYMGMFAR